MLFDSHAHLNDEALIEQIEIVLANAKKNNVEKILCVGYDKDSSLLAVELANQYDRVYAAIGIHPSEANRFDIDTTWMEPLFADPKVVAIGEIGLDYYWDKAHVDEQKQLFQKQIELANKYHLPISIHMRDATNDTYLMLKEFKDPNTSGVMHCYSSSKESMQQFLDLNMYIS
ncbi:MAG: TatD family hydrolase, partial [Bacilli bacterium]|nr:TatD family hydrolase [Bacilli bacterium]